MDLRLELDTHDQLVVHLTEGPETTVVASPHAGAAAGVLVRALEDALDGGYGECFWNTPTGQYWWMFQRRENALEVVAMWSRGGATGWQHAFRAADDAAFLADRVHAEIAACGLALAVGPAGAV